MKDMNPQNAVRRAFSGKRRMRGWRNTHFGSFDAVKAHPLSICRFRPDEGGTVSTNLNVRAAPVNGYTRSKMYVDVVQVFVPYQAIEKLELDTQDDAGVTEMSRRRLMAGQGIGLEDEGTITKAANIHPRSVGGNKRVNKSARLAYICAVNHMRLHAYYAATMATKTETAILPAILTANILERFDGVLDPERHIDGAINLTGELPVKGLFVFGGTNGHIGGTETGGTAAETYFGWKAGEGLPGVAVGVEQDPDNGSFPKVVAETSGADNLPLRDMIESQKLDALIRKFAAIRKDDPVNGEEAIERALYGISVDYDHNCQVMYRHVHPIAPIHRQPTDGASINDVSGHFELNTSFATLVPRGELGGQLVTLVSLKPVETLLAQPDPAQTESWELVNRIHDETELDEVLLTRADLESGVSAVDEDTSAFWTGHNSIKHNYGTQGPNVQQTTGVQMKSSMWTYEVPTSVTPDNVNYPDTITMYPFFNWSGGHAEYTVSQVAAISTHLAKGPNPIEKIALFADDPTLVNPDA